jgi:hypothetical protein
MSEQKYEVVGLTRAEAVRIAEQIGQGAVLSDRGHTYPDDGVIIRPMGCKCPQCSTLETRSDRCETREPFSGARCHLQAGHTGDHVLNVPPERDDETCTTCKGTGWDSDLEKKCDCV